MTELIDSFQFDPYDLPDGIFCYCCQNFMSSNLFYHPSQEMVTKAVAFVDPVSNYNKLIYQRYLIDTYDRREHPYCIDCLESHHVSLFREFSMKAPGRNYLMSSDYGYKIGYAKNIDARLQGLRREFGSVQLIHEFLSGNARKTERHLHSIFCHRHIQREFYDLTENDQRYVRGIV